MNNKKRIRDYGITIGKIKTGSQNKITDVAGVKVGHVTLKNGEINTGITALLPHEGNLFTEKVAAAVYVANGFGKTMGAIQIEELGNIETPILLTNTLSIGIASDTLIDYMLTHNQDIGLTTGTVNPVIGECNDAYLNDIRGKHIKKEDIHVAIQSAAADFEEGCVGAGTGMSSYGLKGGIGSSSRVIAFEEKEYVVGVLTLTNMGRTEDFILNGKPIGRIIAEEEKKCTEQERDKGSIIMIAATDIPLSDRQLKRVAKRAAAGLVRTGSFMGHGSGDIVIAFSTANKIYHHEERNFFSMNILKEELMDCVFQGVVEATEEAILNAMITADTTVGRNGHIRYSLREYAHLF